MKILLLTLFFSSSVFSAIQPLDQVIYMKTPISFKDKAKPFIPAIISVSKELSIDTLLLYSLIWTETHFKVRKSKVGASGLMQIMPKTEEYLRKKNSVLLTYLKTKYFTEVEMIGKDHFENIILGSLYLKELIVKFKNHKYAIIAYNMGPTRISRMLKRGYSVGKNNQYYKKINKRRRYLARI